MTGIIRGNTANSVWMRAAKSLISSPDTMHQQSRLGLTHELLHVVLCIKDPRQRWVTSRYPAINPAFAIAEVFWILSGSNESSFINYWNPVLPKFAGRGNTYHGAYGFRIKQQFLFDQFERAYNVLRVNPESRQVVIQIWDPEADFPQDDGSPKSQDIPCNICSMLKIRNNKLEWLQVMRSNDLFRGTPYNFVQFTTLQEILAGWLNVELGTYHQISDSLHIYDYDREKFTPTRKSTIHNEDSLSVCKDMFDSIMPQILNILMLFTRNDIIPGDMTSALNNCHMPPGYKNLLLVAAADSARRRGWSQIVDFAVRSCSNRLLVQIWKNWEKRWQ